MAGIRWTREDTIIVLDLYLTRPFRTFSKKAPQVVALAKRLGRTNQSVWMKISNFATLDPNSGVEGLPHISALDVSVWNEFSGRRQELAKVAAEMLAGL